MKNGFKVVDSDMHLIEPADLWQRYIDRKFRDAAPVGSTAPTPRNIGVDSTGGRPIQHREAQPHMLNWFRALAAHMAPVGPENLETSRTTKSFYSTPRGGCKRFQFLRDIRTRRLVGDFGRACRFRARRCARASRRASA